MTHVAAIPWPKRAPAQCLNCDREFPIPLTPVADVLRCPHCGSSAYRWPPQPRRPNGRDANTAVMR